ncbi:MAG: FkbM family methyltransferase [Patescibacteria group bacterium]
MPSKKYKFNNKNLTLNLRDEVDISVANEIFVIREYRSSEQIIKNAKAPILDIGTHAGYFILYCRTFNPTVPIFGFEPEKKNFEFCQKNLTANKIKKVKVLPVAVWSKSGMKNLQITADSQNNFLQENKTSKNSIQVKTTSLTDFFAQNKIKEISLLKMDIEGAEFTIFKNLPSADLKKIKNIILEYHISPKNKPKKIEDILRRNGFEVKRLPSIFDKKMGFIFATNKRVKSL